MKTISKIFKSSFLFTLLLLSLFLIPSCSEDFLDNPPQGYLTDGQFPTSAEDAIRAVNAMYSDLRVWSIYYGGYPIVDIMSDDAHKGSNPGDGVNMSLFENYTFGASIGDLAAWYASLYEAIKTTHVVIDKVPEIDMNETSKTQYIAQARFLRALHYFTLVRSFGDVPKVTGLNPPADLSRSPKAEIYSEIIIPDLIDPELHAEVLSRVAKFKSAPYGGFINPRLVPVEEDGKITDIKVEYPDDFATQMLYYSDEYSTLPKMN